MIEQISKVIFSDELLTQLMEQFITAAKESNTPMVRHFDDQGGDISCGEDTLLSGVAKNAFEPNPEWQAGFAYFMDRLGVLVAQKVLITPQSDEIIPSELFTNDYSEVEG